MRPEPLQAQTSEPVQLRLSLGERIDPAAADALWRLVLGGVEADPDGGPSAEGAGTRQADRLSEPPERTNEGRSS